ncbi:iron ABC transporter permease [Nitratireductor indicus C115]|uniref:Iron ABC transporter permease n=1 Tax=Nitratireductor indicus C115 TaxID=1231190 RepID=K2PQ67_9HYPH|nr:iron ABC transporter permease [Nitratireductor indicus]EKF43187.1 iron ABC transporter permease [Nitratireductor indicus C115]SFQ53512.1 iron complex transport system permease protein [Nitratireductor indicus]
MILARALDGRRVVRLSGGLQIRVGDLTTLACLLVAILIAAIVSLTVGTTPITLGDAAATLRRGPGGGDLAFAIWEVRLPRILMGVLVGGSIALTGAMLQSLSQNPLADPGLLGLSQGSMTALMLIFVLFPTMPQGVLPLAALGGGLAVGILLLLLVGRGNAGGMAILLMGIAVETTLSSVTSVLVLYTPPEVSLALADWMAGSLFRSSWNSLATFTPWFALGVPAILLLGRSLRSYDMGDQMAMSLGENLPLSKPVILVTAVLLTSAAVSAVGPLAFLGVMAPHLANFISPTSGRGRLVLSAAVGSLLVICADMMTRAFAGDIPLPTGLAIVMLGVPMFILTLRLRAMRRMRRQ